MHMRIWPWDLLNRAWSRTGKVSRTVAVLCRIQNRSAVRWQDQKQSTAFPSCVCQSHAVSCCLQSQRAPDLPLVMPRADSSL